MTLSFPAFADNSECMILHDRGAADSAKEALLHPASEFNDCNFRRRLKSFVSGLRIATLEENLQFRLLLGLLEE